MINKMNDLIGKRYNRKEYHCWNFIEEVYGDKIPKLKVNPDNAKAHILEYKNYFIKIQKPIDNCLVIMNNHIGIFYKDYVYHNSKDGVIAELLININYYNISFYNRRK